MAKVWFDGKTRRREHRLVNLYYVDQSQDTEFPGRPLSEILYFGDRLGRFVREAAGVEPRIVCEIGFSSEQVALRRVSSNGKVSAVRGFVLQNADRSLVAGLQLDVRCKAKRCIAYLEDCYYLDVLVGGQSISDALERSLRPFAPDGWSMGPLGPETHQIVVLGRYDPDVVTTDAIRRLVYRADLPVRSEHSSIIFPSELNRSPTAVAAVGSYVSVIGGRQEYMESSIVLSAAVLQRIVHAQQ